MTRAEVTSAGPLDVRGVLRTERALLLELLGTLEPAEWQRATECPAYDVQGVAAHLLGDDVSLLSRQRDSAPNGLLRRMRPGDDFRTALDRFNDRWVEAVEFFSPALLVELLELTGRWTADWYDDVDPDSPGEPVGFFNAIGPSLQARASLSSPYWQASAREYVERWVHHHQIRRALARPNLDDDAILYPAAAAVVRSIAAHSAALDAHTGASMVLSVEGLASWTWVRGPESWQLFDGAHPDEVTVVLSIDRAVATPLLSRGLPATEVVAAFSIRGDTDLGNRAVSGIAMLAARG